MVSRVSLKGLYGRVRLQGLYGRAGLVLINQPLNLSSVFKGSYTWAHTGIRVNTRP